MTAKMNLFQQTAAVAMLAAFALVAPAAMAHGSVTAVHGGVVQTASDLSFELVGTPEGAAIYIQDHGKDADASKFDGKLTVLNGVEKSEAPLKPVGANKLEAKGVALNKGAKAVAVLTTSSKKSITVRFSVK
ncbi:hypothetical protein [Acidovorax sp. BL-A-41-H1]|uniref:hypothetical protein n=1 Tax=Acidovorax sp. BL-A-41-H1 TaxID=3421102 RepID=UPI003F796C59